MQEWFTAHGIDINDPQFTRWVEKSKHTNIIHRGNSPQNPGGAWNAEWRAYRDAENLNGTGYSRDAVIQKMIDLRNDERFRLD